MMATTEALLTVDEFSRLPDLGQRAELVRGKILMMNMPGARHGKVCARIAFALMSFNERQRLGHVMTNDAGVVTTREPDSVRGPDVAFYSFQRLPMGDEPSGYPALPPELVFEVLSPSDRWRELQQKAVEYLDAGVDCVCVVDPAQETVTLYYQDRPPETHAGEALFEVADILPGFSVPVRRFFEDTAT
ncbi:MAG TPA: Uma2 family endonuclease [Pirellulales bacterium]|nr:Uma2 family endonuclease [Pirellulales bacterium]